MGLGPLFRSSQPVELTESETEYTVSVIKHVFPTHVVLQFDCTNTLNDQLLEDVSIQLELPEGFELVATVPCERLEYNIKVQKSPDNRTMLNHTSLLFTQN